jgi:hypothetical protein
MAGAVTASAVVVEEATVVVVEEATAVTAETNPNVDLSGIMGMGQRSYAPATAMPWRVATSLTARHLMVARPTVEGPTVATNTNSRQLLNLGRRMKPETAGALQFRRSIFAGLQAVDQLFYGSLQTALQHNIVACRPAHLNLLPSPAKASAECLLPADRHKS